MWGRIGRLRARAPGAAPVRGDAPPSLRACRCASLYSCPPTTRRQQGESFKRSVGVASHKHVRAARGGCTYIEVGLPVIGCLPEPRRHQAQSGTSPGHSAPQIRKCLCQRHFRPHPGITPESLRYPSHISPYTHRMFKFEPSVSVGRDNGGTPEGRWPEPVGWRLPPPLPPAISSPGIAAIWQTHRL